MSVNAGKTGDGNFTRYNDGVSRFPVTFDSPEFLWLLPISVAAIWLVGLLSGRKMSRQQIRQMTIIRYVVVTLACLAAAGFRWHSQTDRLTTIYVLDVSDSISLDQRHAALSFINKSLESEKSGDNVGLVIFGQEPFLEFPPGPTLDTTRLSPTVPGGSTNIQSAIDAASGAMPNDTGKRIVLFTDGLENSGDARSSIAGLRNQGVEVDVAPSMLEPSGRVKPEALVDRIVTPVHAELKAPFPIRIVLSSTVDQNAELTISRDGRVIQKLSVALHVGKSSFETADKIMDAGRHQYTVDLTPELDTQSQNNMVTSQVIVAGAPRVLLMRDANEALTSALPAALKAQGLNVVTMTPADAPQTVSGFAGFDSIILSDVGAGDVSPKQMSGLKIANREFGVGLGMIGGVNSFGAGGFAGTPVEDALPVKMTPRRRSKIPAADVIIVLDASGSMSAEEDGVEKVEIAARAALNLLKALQPTDKVGVLAVTETAEIVMPLVSPSQSSKYVPAIEAVTAGGGGIDCRNGLEAAYTLLQMSDASIKHVIICPDTTDSEQQEGCVSLATEVYKTSNISTSVCGIGDWSDPDVPFQRAVATAGHGQLFVANQAGNLPLFFQRDVQDIGQKMFDEGNFVVDSSGDDSVVAADSGIPNLLGYNLTNPKPDATVALSLTKYHDPLLAYWQDGLGRSFAFTSDDQAHWATKWIGWDQYPPTWARIVRWSLKSKEDDSFQALVTNQKGQGHIVVDAFNAAGFATDSHFQATVANPDDSVTQVSLNETSPGRYEATFETDAVGNYLVQINNPITRGSQSASVSTSYSPEYAGLRPDTELLSEISQQTGGSFLTSPSQVFRSDRVWNLGSFSLVQQLLLLSGVIFLLDVAWRRFGWRIRNVQTGPAKIRETAVVVVQSVRDRSAAKLRRRDTIGSIKSAAPVDEQFLRKRTASRANLDDDNPFPYVVSLPPRRPKERDESVLKDIK
jgi:Ca-activated chloride channel homolog